MDSDPIYGVDSKKVMLRRKSSLTTPTATTNKKAIRTLKFEMQGKRVTIHTILNVYESDDGSYEAVLRYGDQEGLCSGKYGNTIRFNIGNATAVEFFCAHFKSHYGLTNKCISDTSTAKSLAQTANPTQSDPNTAASNKLPLAPTPSQNLLFNQLGMMNSMNMAPAVRPTTGGSSRKSAKK